MRNAVGRTGIVRIGDIVEEDHRVVLGCVQAVVGERADGAANAFLIRLP